MTSKQVLIIEQDQPLVAELRSALRELGCELTHRSFFPFEQLDDQGTHRYNLVICDSVAGDDLAEQLISLLKQLAPFILLTTTPATVEEAKALELGADDYLAKPYSVRELLARVRALFRREELEARAAAEREEAEAKILVFDDLSINLTTRQVTYDGTPLSLTNTEYAILTLLAASAGRPVSREQLVELVWGYPSTEHNQAVMTHVSRLRGKLEAARKGTCYIETIRGLGYRFTGGSA